VKILFQTDPHIKEIGPHANESRYGPKYSTRLDQTIKSFEWFYDIARKLNVDVVIHGGDVVDKPVILAKESHALKESFSFNTSNIPEYILVGNHDRKDKISHALAILDNYPNIKIIDKPLKLDDISFLPFDTDISEDVYKELSNKVLFSHIDILGTQFAEHIFSTKGADPEVLKRYFQIVYNGHLHNPSKNGIVYNLGAFIGSGFGDDYTNYQPSAFYIDTETLTIRRFPNPHAILYITIKSNNMIEIKNRIESLLENHNPFYLRVQCTNEIKRTVRELVDTFMTNPKILSSIILGTSREKRDINLSAASSIQLSQNPIESILGYIKSLPDAKLPSSRLELNKFVTDEYTLGDTNVNV
jgi:predicted phosphodiesterase